MFFSFCCIYFTSSQHLCHCPSECHAQMKVFVFLYCVKKILKLEMEKKKKLQRMMGAKQKSREILDRMKSNESILSFAFC